VPSAQVEMSVRVATPDVKIIDIKGEITAYAEPILMESYSQASGGGCRLVVLNFTDLDYMNSSGIGLLVTLLIRAQRNGQKLAAFGLTEHYRQILNLTRLDEAIGVFADEASALGAA